METPVRAQWGGSVLFRPAAFVFLALLVVALTAASVYFSSPPGEPRQFAHAPGIASVDSPKGLDVSLSLNATSIKSGQSVAISVDLTNVEQESNYIGAAGLWAAPGFQDGPCGNVNFPMGYEILEGDQTLSTFKDVSPLMLYTPGIYSCPMILAQVIGYRFEPLSNLVSLYQESSAGPVLTEKANVTVAFSGTWDNTGAFHAFNPGSYTVVAGDEWGDVVLMHFSVLA